MKNRYVVVFISETPINQSMISAWYESVQVVGTRHNWLRRIRCLQYYVYTCQLTGGSWRQALCGGVVFDDSILFVDNTITGENILFRYDRATGECIPVDGISADMKFAIGCGLCGAVTVI